MNEISTFIYVLKLVNPETFEKFSPEEEAKDFMKNDPAVKKGIMTAEMHLFRVALIEKG